MNTTSRKILAIRNAARKSLNMGPCTSCPTCARGAADPYRRSVNGEILEGCVDAFHTDALTPTTESFRWHFRSVAVEIRKANLAFLLR